MFCHSCISSSIYVQISDGTFYTSILVAPCWMEVPWLSTVLNMLEDILYQCPVITDLIRDCLVSQALNGLLSLY